MNCIKKTAILPPSLLASWSINALARPPIPPPEAYTACKGKQPGEKVSFTSRKGHDVSGVCEQQEDGRLFLKPGGHPGKTKGNGKTPKNK